MNLIQSLKSRLKRKTRPRTIKDVIAEDKPELELVYIDKNGKEWFAYRDRLAMPYSRLVAIETAAVYDSMKITKEKLEANIDSIIDAVNKGDIAKIAGIALHIKGLINLRVEEETLLTIAAGFFLSKEEFDYEQSENGGYNSAEQQRKIKYWRETPECLDFFLELALKRLSGFTNLSAKGMRDYLDKYKGLLQQRKEEILGLSSKYSTDTTT